MGFNGWLPIFSGNWGIDGNFSIELMGIDCMSDGVFSNEKLGEKSNRRIKKAIDNYHMVI